MAVQPGTLVTLKTNSHRYCGGDAVVIRQVQRGTLLRYLVRRTGEIGQGKREILVREGEFFSPPPEGFIPLGA